ncbi:hypothetical protein ACPWL5_004535 [Escherichia coli]
MLRINVFAKDKGWLFNDLKNHFNNSISSLTISNDPKKNHDLYICIRSSEAKLSPSITNTIIQVHNMEPHDIHLFNSCLGVIFTHPMQEWLWKRSGFNNHHITIPIGARKACLPFSAIPLRPAVGFYCGENKLKQKGSHIFKQVIIEARKQMEFDVIMIGRGLDHIAELGIYEQRAAEPIDYSRIDTLISASVSPGVPLSVYEALSCGKPVITTPRWFPTGRWKGVRIGSSKHQLVTHLIKTLQNREFYLVDPHKFAYSPYILEDWIDKNIKYAIKRYNSRFNWLSD